MPKPFRFGVQSFNSTSGKAWSETARKVEALGFPARSSPITCSVPDRRSVPEDAMAAFAPVVARLNGTQNGK